MHKLSVATLLFAALALPGCIFAVGGESWDSDGDCCAHCPHMAKVEKRLSTLEHHCKGECATNCPMCAKPAEKPAETKTAP